MSALASAQKMNENDELPVYGIVTDGELWQFGKLIQNEFTKEKIRLTINDLSEIFGVIAYLLEAVKDYLDHKAKSSANEVNTIIKAA